MSRNQDLGILPAALLALAALVGWSDAGAAAPKQEEGGWVLRAGPMWMESGHSDGSVIGHRGDGVSGFEPRGVGLSVAGEYRQSQRLGLEVGVLATSNGAGARYRDGRAVAVGTSSYGSLWFGPNVHLTPDRAADLFFGPFLAYTARTDVGFDHDEWAGVRIDSSFGWGAVLGVDIPVGGRGWRVCTSVRYIDTNLDGTDRNGDPFELDVGPTAVGVGVGYRF